MHEAFSYNREYDYIRLDGLGRATGRPAHEWDLYIVKELIDNALDADETLWRIDPQKNPSLHIRIEYISVPPPQCQQLLVRVGNRALFPVKQIQDIFATQWYTSRKAFFKGLTRGALGNALKTLLGIPYALHNRMADDWKPDLKPLSICCNGTEYLPRYIVDPIAQTIRLECETKLCKSTTGTVISVGVDYFVQEKPRTLADIEALVQQYSLCNPHAEFSWTVEIGNQIWEKECSTCIEWRNKFRGVAPVQWYPLTDFKDLLGALYREQCGKEKDKKLPVQTVCQFFLDSEAKNARQNFQSAAPIIQEVGQDDLSTSDIESSLIKTLYVALGKYSQPFHSSQLGYLGQEHITTTLKSTFEILGTIQYAMESDNDPSMPFVIEAAVAFLQEGKRQVWTAINFSPTYADPFLSRWLQVLIRPNELVLGLRGLLDAYGFREDTPMVLFLHLICPNIEHNEFSKTDINHLPFKKALGILLDKLLTEMRQSQEEEEMLLEKSILMALTAILAKLAPNERFIVDQLLEKLRVQLRQDQALVSWLERPESLNRLRAYIASYQNTNPDVNRFVARQAEVLLYVPLHPNRYFSIPINHISHDLLERNYVNKVFYVQAREMEPVIIENNWLCRMDMALLHAPSGANVLEAALLQCLGQSELPILLLHNADDDGYTLVEQMQMWLTQHHENALRIVDLSPPKEIRPNNDIVPLKLMPGELETWLLKRFDTLGIAVKYLPPYAHIRRNIRERFEQRLEEYVIEGMKQKYGLTNLIIDLDKTFAYTTLMMNEALDEQLKRHLREQACTESYASVLEMIVAEFFEHFMETHATEIQLIEQTWITEKQSR